MPLTKKEMQQLKSAINNMRTDMWDPKDKSLVGLVGKDRVLSLLETYVEEEVDDRIRSKNNK